MKVEIADQVSTKLHIDDNGVVWYMDGSDDASPSGLSFNQFLSSNLITGKRLKLVGSRTNSSYIMGLYYKKLRGEIESLQVCSPLCCPVRLRESAGHVLMAMHQWSNRSASTGGWHEVDEYDYVLYRLKMVLEKSEKSLSEEVYEALKAHPAWPAISFIPHVDPLHVARLCVYIVDPRWYVDPDSPDKGSRLESYLGLHPKTQRGVSAEGPTYRLHNQCKLVVDCWKTKGFEKRHLDNPANFLIRIWKHHGQGYMADLRTSQYFLNYLRLIWLDAIYQKHRKGERLFVAKYFFGKDRVKEAEAYDLHCLNMASLQNKKFI